VIRAARTRRCWSSNSAHPSLRSGVPLNGAHVPCAVATLDIFIPYIGSFYHSGVPLSGAQYTLALWFFNRFAEVAGLDQPPRMGARNSGRLSWNDRALRRGTAVPAKASNFNQLTLYLEMYAFRTGIQFAPARN
jgi:hypothetical protein